MSSPKEKASVVSDQSETIDPKTFRKGDRVWVEAEILDDGPTVSGDWRVYPEKAVYVASAPVAAIVKHIPSPRPIAVGDRASWGSHASVEVLAVDGEWAWIITTGNTRYSTHVSNLERVEP